MDLPANQSVSDPIVIHAEASNHWKEGNTEIWVLRGNVQIQQGASLSRGRESVLWIVSSNVTDDKLAHVTAYLEGDVSIDVASNNHNSRLTDLTWLGRFNSRAGVQVHCLQEAGKPEPLPPVYERAQAQRDASSASGAHASVLQSQYVAPIPDGTPANEPPPGTRRLRAFARGETQLRFEWIPEPSTNQWVAVIDGGVNVIVDGLPKFGSLDVSSDRAVIWTAATQEPNLNGHNQSADTPLELYLEGNIVFRQGNRVIYADRMYYNVRSHVGTVLEADMLSPVASYSGLLRLHARVLQQLGQDHFFAQDSFFTSSRMGDPGYRVQAGDVTVDDIQNPVTDPLTGKPEVDPLTGQPKIDHQRKATGKNAVVYIEDVPVFYWPTFATNLDRPDYYVRRLQYKTDGIFGNQFGVHLDPYQLLGCRNRPAGTDWDFGIDYMSMRGLGVGTTYIYSEPNLFNFGGPATGLLDFWGIKDSGRDVLGPAPLSSLDRGADYRYRLLWQHREQLPNNFQLTAEVNKISDINFLNQYFPREWNEMAEGPTDVELKQFLGNSTWDIFASAHLNDFTSDTQWLPRLEHFWLGQPLLDDKLTWFEHSQIGYEQTKIADQPSLATSPTFTLLPWETRDTSGGRYVTRQEIDYPFQLGPVKMVPYGLGELAHWDEDLLGQPLNRMYGVAGIRASMPVWSVNPNIQSDLWNVHGVAHKIVFGINAFVSGTNQSMIQNGQSIVPMDDPLDDMNILYNRRMFGFTDFGMGLPTTLGTVQNLPLQFDPRLYALRTGLGTWVTSPSTDIAGNMAAIQLSANQRWQTKRGPADNQHITDWITLDTDMTIFPNPNHDDFGSTVGLAEYDFHWFVGDRLTVLSSGIFDFFPGGQKIATAGLMLNRPPRGDLYLGFYSLDGPVEGKIVTLAYNYWMSPKWVSQLATSVDISGNGNIGQSLTVTRVGESFLVSASLSVDAIRGTTGFSFLIEPRFMSKGKLGNVGGARVPVAGAYGLE